MRLAFDIPPSVHRVLHERAERSGMSLESWVVDLLSKEAGPPVTADQIVPAGSWVDEWLASAPRMTPEDARAIEEAVAWMDAASLAAPPVEPID